MEKNTKTVKDSKAENTERRQPSVIGNIKSLGNAVKNLYATGTLTDEEFNILAGIHGRILNKEMGGLSL